ncbi:MAG: DMT family transporter [Candidatus Neomarinimicrobiota bacterium]
MKSSRIILIFMVALLAVSVSSIMARMIPAVPAVIISFWRLAVGAAVLWGYSALRPQIALTSSQRNTTRIAGLFLALHFICFFGALKYTSVAHTTVLAATTPFFTALIERFILKRPWNKKVIAGLVLAFAGVLIIQNGEVTSVPKNQVGNILALFSGFWIAIVLILAERVRKKAGIVSYARLLYTTAAVILLALAVSMDTALLPDSKSAYLWLILLGLIPTVIGHTLFYYSVKFVSPTIVTAVPLGEPVLASLLAFAFFSEAVGVFVIGGGLLTLFGLYIIIFRH